MRTRIDKHHRIPMPQHQVRIAEHSSAIVCVTMQQNHRIPIPVDRPHTPPAKDLTVCRGVRDIHQRSLATCGNFRR
jgi:hypothetical protein